jgi:hypothetical protein
VLAVPTKAAFFSVSGAAPSQEVADSVSNVQSACALNTVYIDAVIRILRIRTYTSFYIHVYVHLTL